MLRACALQAAIYWLRLLRARLDASLPEMPYVRGPGSVTAPELQGS